MEQNIRGYRYGSWQNAKRNLNTDDSVAFRSYNRNKWAYGKVIKPESMRNYQIQTNTDICIVVEDILTN